MSTTVTLNIPAISCGHCVATIQRETKEVPGVLTVAGDPQAKTATFTLANEAVLTDVKATLVEIGYPAAFNPHILSHGGSHCEALCGLWRQPYRRASLPHK